MIHMLWTGATHGHQHDYDPGAGLHVSITLILRHILSLMIASAAPYSQKYSEGLST